MTCDKRGTWSLSLTSIGVCHTYALSKNIIKYFIEIKIYKIKESNISLLVMFEMFCSMVKIFHFRRFIGPSCWDLPQFIFEIRRNWIRSLWWGYGLVCLYSPFIRKTYPWSSHTRNISLSRARQRSSFRYEKGKFLIVHLFWNYISYSKYIDITFLVSVDIKD